MASFQLSINGEVQTVEASPEMPLLWVIRDLLGLTGTKYGCGISQCRACTVHIDGVAVPSCQIAVEDVRGPVTTIEGLGADQRDPLEQAWIAEEVPQCGYCQPGQVMAAAALLSKTPMPSDDDIDRGMKNLCRCGTYSRIRKAIHRAAGAKK